MTRPFGQALWWSKIVGVGLLLTLAACETPRESQSSASTTPPASSSSRAATQAVTPGLVRDVQKSLHVHGYSAGPVDGVYGKTTREALRHFQRDRGLVVSGKIDTPTLAALRSDSSSLKTEPEGDLKGAGQRAATSPSRPPQEAVPLQQQQGALPESELPQESPPPPTQPGTLPDLAPFEVPPMEVPPHP